MFQSLLKLLHIINQNICQIKFPFQKELHLDKFSNCCDLYYCTSKLGCCDFPVITSGPEKLSSTDQITGSFSLKTPFQNQGLLLKVSGDEEQQLNVTLKMKRT